MHFRQIRIYPLSAHKMAGDKRTAISWFLQRQLLWTSIPLSTNCLQLSPKWIKPTRKTRRWKRNCRMCGIHFTVAYKVSAAWQTWNVPDGYGSFKDNLEICINVYGFKRWWHAFNCFYFCVYVSVMCFHFVIDVTGSVHVMYVYFVKSLFSLLLLYS